VFWVADEEDAFDCGEGGTGQALEGVDGGGCALRVAFEDEACVGVRGDTSADVVDDL